MKKKAIFNKIQTKRMNLHTCSLPFNIRPTRNLTMTISSKESFTRSNGSDIDEPSGCDSCRLIFMLNYVERVKLIVQGLCGD